jgi:hypothetical protein
VKYELQEGKPVLIKTADYIFVDDVAGKPAGIHQFIGRRQILAVGNSDGDQEMLQYTGTLVTALQEAGPAVWTVVDMKANWNTMFGS